MDLIPTRPGCLAETSERARAMHRPRRLTASLKAGSGLLPLSPDSIQHPQPREERRSASLALEQADKGSLDAHTGFGLPDATLSPSKIRLVGIVQDRLPGHSCCMFKRRAAGRNQRMRV